MRPLCFIFFESSLKTADTWYRIPLKREGGWGSWPALRENTTLSVINTHTHRGNIIAECTHSGRKGVCEADAQTLSYTKEGNLKGPRPTP